MIIVGENYIFFFRINVKCIFINKDLNLNYIRIYWFLILKYLS